MILQDFNFSLKEFRGNYVMKAFWVPFTPTKSFIVKGM